MHLTIPLKISKIRVRVPGEEISQNNKPQGGTVALYNLATVERSKEAKKKKVLFWLSGKSKFVHETLPYY